MVEVVAIKNRIASSIFSAMERSMMIWGTIKRKVTASSIFSATERSTMIWRTIKRRATVPSTFSATTRNMIAWTTIRGMMITVLSIFFAMIKDRDPTTCATTIEMVK
ncbi:hypothetical protein [Pelosinus propionicus]|uniref:hypothetical protein n=1 Tax=Pelosinus propionicus TaxID=380084 RepID=UPI001113ED29|nr:hypothetical protein [Pelosinus propionicus]